MIANKLILILFIMFFVSGCMSRPLSDPVFDRLKSQTVTTTI